MTRGSPSTVTWSPASSTRSYVAPVTCDARPTASAPTGAPSRTSCRGRSRSGWSCAAPASPHGRAPRLAARSARRGARRGRRRPSARASRVVVPRRSPAPSRGVGSWVSQWATSTPIPPAPITATRRPGTTRPASTSAYDTTEGWSMPVDHRDPRRRLRSRSPPRRTPRGRSASARVDEPDVDAEHLQPPRVVAERVGKSSLPGTSIASRNWPPIAGPASNRVTAKPRSAAETAAASPAGPAPTTATVAARRVGASTSVVSRQARGFTRQVAVRFCERVVQAGLVARDAGVDLVGPALGGLARRSRGRPGTAGPSRPGRPSPSASSARRARGC